MDKKEELTVRKFMLKKFHTDEYIDCPIPKHHWETIQEYADLYASQEKEKDAICFAEWVAVNPLVIISSAPKWHYDNGNNHEEITIGQLYEIYLKEKTK